MPMGAIAKEILKGKELSIELHLPWKMIEEKKEAIEKEIQEVRTPAYILNTSQIFSFAGKFLTLRRRRDSNPRCLAAHSLSRTAV